MQGYHLAAVQLSAAVRRRSDEDHRRGVAEHVPEIRVLGSLRVGPRVERRQSVNVGRIVHHTDLPRLFVQSARGIDAAFHDQFEFLPLDGLRRVPADAPTGQNRLDHRILPRRGRLRLRSALRRAARHGQQSGTQPGHFPCIHKVSFFVSPKITHKNRFGKAIGRFFCPKPEKRGFGTSR